MAFDLTEPGLLLSPEVLADPRPLYDQLRREAPVWQVPGQDTFLVSDPGLVREAVGRPDDLSSNLVTLLRSDGAGGTEPYELLPFGDPMHVLATADPPIHTHHRRLLQQHLSPVAVAALTPDIEVIVDGQLDALVGAGPVDVVAGFGDAVATRVVCRLIGLPDELWPRLADLVMRTGALLDGVTDAAGTDAASVAALELGIIVHGELDAALALPPDARPGLFGVFGADVAAGEITLDEVKSILLILVSAGSETTATLLATALDRLSRDEALQSRLRAEPEGVAPFLEDVLRDDGPFQFHYRYAPADTALGGVPIPAGSRVLLMWAAANRPAPDSLAGPAGGPQPPHYAFGKGMHFCIGAPIARLEARVALERLLARTAAITPVAGDPPTRRPSIFLRRFQRLPLLLTPA